MKKKLLSYVVSACFMLVAGHGMAQDVTAQDLADSWIRAYNAHNGAELASLYSENSVLMLHGEETVRGRQDIGAYWAEDFREGNPITTLAVTHAINGHDLILVHGNYQVIDRESGLSLGSGRFAHMWMMNEDEVWELDRDLWHDPFNPY